MTEIPVETSHGVWTVRVEDSGATSITDAQGRKRFSGSGHETTAVHLALALIRESGITIIFPRGEDGFVGCSPAERCGVCGGPAGREGNVLMINEETTEGPCRYRMDLCRMCTPAVVTSLEALRKQGPA